ncbi:TatD family hydrolase [Parvibium lacunae]|uniref:TatD family deoxyribonuclease n=1 Tax=Parvibium lacunae TaxID=1888893 RepID=A0A368L7F5_9BURK|nr:TatD family hydrolase [Parvibium lacunae]RCS59628.1 TatD family deoxyribonuclease [Parvibium lacunae]
MFVDSHCHLDFPQFSTELPQIYRNMAAHAVTHALCISVNLPDFPRVLQLAESQPFLFASVGVHPDYEETPEPSVEELVRLAAHPKIVAIGETGLDYYRLNGRTIEEMAWQRQRFCTHIQAARQVKKPLIIHTRQAATDTLELMRAESAHEAGGVLHCFTETADFARAVLDMGFYISFSGIVSFKNAADLREVARWVPADRLLIETDSPYLAPVPMRGKVNQPAYVKHVATCLAELRQVSVDALATQTTANFFRLFRHAQPTPQSSFQ